MGFFLLIGAKIRHNAWHGLGYQLCSSVAATREEVALFRGWGDGGHAVTGIERNCAEYVPAVE